MRILNKRLKFRLITYTLLLALYYFIDLYTDIDDYIIRSISPLAFGQDCFKTTFPRLLGGTNDETDFNAVDMDSSNNFVIGGWSKDNKIVTSGRTPIIIYIAEGNYIVWGYQISVSGYSYAQIQYLVFNPSGSKIAFVFYQNDYDSTKPFFVGVLSKYGGYVGGYMTYYSWTTQCNYDCIKMDSSDYIYMAQTIKYSGKYYANFIKFKADSAAQTTVSFSLLNSYYDSYAHVLECDSTYSTFYLGAVYSDWGLTNQYLAVSVYSSAGVKLNHLASLQSVTSSNYAFDRMAVLTSGTKKYISGCGNNDLNGNAYGFFFFNMVHDTSAGTYTTNLKVSSTSDLYCLETYPSASSTPLFLLFDTNSGSNNARKIRYGYVDFSNNKFYYETTNYWCEKNNFVNHGVFKTSTQAYYVGHIKKTCSASMSNWNQQVAFLHTYDTLFSDCLSTTSGFSQKDNLQSSGIVSAPSSGWTFLVSDYASIHYINGSIPFTRTALISVNQLDNTYYCDEWKSYTIVAPTVPDITYYIGSGSVSYIHDPFTITDTSCTDTVFYYYLQKQDNTVYPSSVMSYTWYTLTMKVSASKYTDAATYNLQINATLGNNQTDITTFTLKIIYACAATVVTSTPISDTLFDISQAAAIVTTLAWTSDDPNSPCSDSEITYSAVDADTGLALSTIFSMGTNSLSIATTSTTSVGLYHIKIQADFYGDIKTYQTFYVNVTDQCATDTIYTMGGLSTQLYTLGGATKVITVTPFTDSAGNCGTFTYTLTNFDGTAIDSNFLTFDATLVTLTCVTSDSQYIGDHNLKVTGTLPNGLSASFTFTLSIFNDPCYSATITAPTQKDFPFYIAQTGNSQTIPEFTSSLPSCGSWNYKWYSSSWGSLDSIFSASGNTITMYTTDTTKKDISPYKVNVQAYQGIYSSCNATLSFYIYVVYNDPTDCPVGKYYSTTTLQCETCPSPCSSCLNATACLWCVTGYYYIEDGSYTCQQSSLSCPSGTLKDSTYNVCRECPQYCETCTSTTECTQCLSDYTLVDGQCDTIKQCPSGFRYDQSTNECEECSANCEICATSNRCRKCNDGYFVETDSDLCVSTCPTGTYGNVDSGTCMICQEDCTICSGNNYTCFQCEPNYYLYQQRCVERCPYSEYYQDYSNRSCEACEFECEVCIDSASDCAACKPGYVQLGRTCMDKCPSQYFNTDTNMCLSCHPACEYCNSPVQTDCTKCNPGYFLFNSVCDTSCPVPYFANAATTTCDDCMYFCTNCTSLTVCNECKTGYETITDSCLGEYFLKTSTSFQMNVPVNPDKTTDYDPQYLTFEVWFKGDDMTSSNLEVILGVSPYKLRKRATNGQIQVNYMNLINYCETPTLDSDSWYHFAATFNELTSNFSCYLNGKWYSIGSNPMVLITTNVQKLTEITFGGTIDPKGSEQNFNGYIKEFRWWGEERSEFEIYHFKNILFSTIPSTMIAYWKLNEKNDGTYTYFTDSASAGNITFTPTTYAVADVVEMREIYLKLCPEGYYVTWDNNLEYYVCQPCSSGCKNCADKTVLNCTECYAPYTLMESETKCIYIDTCPDGQYKDPDTSLCTECHPYCVTCYDSATTCPICKTSYFREYLGTGCVSDCPTGMYGVYSTQTCVFSPVITSISPDDGSVIEYGTFIDMMGSFILKNDEPRSSYSYGWIVTRMDGSIDVTNDIIKTYANTDILKVHLDNNIIQANNYYNLTLYVKGDSSLYKGFYSYSFNEIYVGQPPIGGKCSVSPISGIGSITSFTLTTSEWVDSEGIAQYNFYFSFDSGETYIPISSEDVTKNTVDYIFPNIYLNYDVTLKCEVVNQKGFTASAYTAISLAKKSSADATSDIRKYSVLTVQSEEDCIEAVLQLYLMVQSMGSLTTPTQYVFDPKITSDQCTKDICNSYGTCNYLYYSKKYYCSCEDLRGGQNCTFKNKTDLELAQNLTASVGMIYQTITDREYEYVFLKLTTQFKEQMNDDSFAVALSVLRGIIFGWESKSQSSDTIKQYLIIASNLFEYLEYDQIRNNMTGYWNNDANKMSTVLDNLNSTVSLINIMKSNTLNQISDITTTFYFTTRMVAYRQTRATQESTLRIQATNFTKKEMQAFIKISSANFMNSSVQISDPYIIEAIEYAVNPYELLNVQNIATNVFDVTFYNFSSKTPAKVQNLSTGLEIYFPGYDNQNLSNFISDYNNLNPFKQSQKVKRYQMIQNSLMNCAYRGSEIWENDGCTFVSLDTTHIKCSCTHLTAFGPQFITPPVDDSSDTSTDTTVEKAKYQPEESITLDDILVWPLDKYFSNLSELIQHKPPKMVDFIFKPGLYLILAFWLMYCSGLIFYSGKDRLKRFAMTKGQNRDDLAEMKDDEIQCIDQVIKDLMIRDAALKEHELQQKENGFDEKEKSSPSKKKQSKGSPKKTKNDDKPMSLVFEELSTEQQKEYKKRARRKVFGRVGTLDERARRFYKRTQKIAKKLAEERMKFFNEEMKNSLFFGLIAKTSKIAPRHVRMTLMYMYTAIHLSILTFVYMFGFQYYIENSMFQVGALAGGCLLAPWILTFPVALMFRMPMSLRREMEGVKSKKLNHAFQELDRQMGCRYAFGYFFALTVYCIMTVMVLFFNYFYPVDYTLSWFMTFCMIFFIDSIVMSFVISGFQLLNALIANKVPCWYKLWAFFEKFRYLKNLRG